MNEISVLKVSYVWLPVLAGLSSACIFLPIAFYSPDFGALLYFLLVCLAGIVLALRVFFNAGKQRVTSLVTLAIICLISWALLAHYGDVRNVSRWMVESEAFKSDLMAQPTPANGEFRHVEWDEWGFPGAGDTIEYLLFDPADSLAAAPKNQSPTKYDGIPCPVTRVRRLESQWYSVRFYTESDWNHCS